MDYPQKISESIYVLGNHYLPTYLIIGGKKSALIEPGISSTAFQIVDQIKSLDIDPSSIEMLILTHAHADHITGAPVLKKAMPWLIVLSSAETNQLLKKEKVKKIFLKDDLDISRQLKTLNIYNKYENVGNNLENLIDVTISSGDRIDLGDIFLEAIAAPGHCLGGLAFWEPEAKVLFCSDFFGFYLPPDKVVPNFYVDFRDYMTSFESLIKLGPHWVCPGHCGVYHGKNAMHFIDQARTEIEWIYHRVIREDKSPTENFEVLLGELFNTTAKHRPLIF